VTPVPASPLALAAALVERWGLWLAALLLLTAPLYADYTPFYMALLTEVLVFGLFALAYDVLLGNAGVLSLGHSAFFGVAAYTTGMLLALLRAPLEASLLAGAVAGLLTALLLGVFALRKRGVYLAMLTLALSQVFYYAALMWPPTGGTDGLGNLPILALSEPLGLRLSKRPVTRYLVVVALVFASMLVIRRILRSPFGRVMRAVKANERRAQACGYDTTRIKLVAFGISGFFSGLAGGLLTVVLEFVPIEHVHWSTSGTVLVMTLFGGTGTLLGPFVGSAVFVWMRDFLSKHLEHWEVFVGGAFVLIVLFFPEGIVGTVRRLVRARLPEPVVAAAASPAVLAAATSPAAAAPFPGAAASPATAVSSPAAPSSSLDAVPPTAGTPAPRAVASTSLPAAPSSGGAAALPEADARSAVASSTRIPAANGRPLLESRGLTKHFGGLSAVNGVDFQVRPGELRAVIGPNGAGKTTFFNVLTGVLPASAGTILFKGRDITGLPAHAVSRLGVARSYQVTNIFGDLTVLENVRIAAQSRVATYRFWRSADRLTGVNERAEAILRLIGLEAKRHLTAAALSHGEQRYLEIGIALATEPDFLLLDEPTAGMSPEETQQAARFIRALAGRVTIVLVEHDMEVVMGISDRITVLNYGQVLAEGTPAEIRDNAEVRRVYLRD
jgi:ABC-type branched-subunit amino acid transport system ATPase component/ABC-type branched-subunit amino acid transport system permease subunit